MSNFIHYSNFDIKKKLIQNTLKDVLPKDIINFCMLPYLDTTLSTVSNLDIKTTKLSPNKFLVQFIPKIINKKMKDIENDIVSKSNNKFEHYYLWSINFFPPDSIQQNYKGLEKPLSCLLNKAKDDSFLWIYMSKEELDTPFCIKFVNRFSYEMEHIIQIN